MKTILTFLMPLITIVSSVASFNLFTDASYYSSAVLTVVAYLSASASVYLISRKVKVALH